MIPRYSSKCIFIEKARRHRAAEARRLLFILVLCACFTAAVWWGEANGYIPM